ncbi:hypothetical protein EVAR_34035_1 [Eumeta japonica]|uniref:Uncharacterized protein n=1 Tax=Eumeta variegata TaxID=151549 RepID=A0A4C1VTB8_EUMVA|nr:hypothetical protein EVAR_34035_1 [Eumeta japonica]
MANEIAGLIVSRGLQPRNQKYLIAIRLYVSSGLVVGRLSWRDVRQPLQVPGKDLDLAMRRQGWQNATGPRPKRAPAQEAASSEIFFLTLYLSSKNASGQCSKSEELDFTKSIPELPDAAPDTSVYPDPEQPQQGTSKIKVNHILV